jgi:hypothetical protein
LVLACVYSLAPFPTALPTVVCVWFACPFPTVLSTVCLVIASEGKIQSTC